MLETSIPITFDLNSLIADTQAIPMNFDGLVSGYAAINPALKK